jgi:hypothetical protein
LLLPNGDLNMGTCCPLLFVSVMAGRNEYDPVNLDFAWQHVSHTAAIQLKPARGGLGNFPAGNNGIW